MRSRLQGIILFGIAAFLLATSKKELVTSSIQEWRIRRKMIYDASESQRELVFDRQALEYDSMHQQFKNPELYFEIVRLGSIDFKKHMSSNKSIEDSSTAENASESN